MLAPAFAPRHPTQRRLCGLLQRCLPFTLAVCLLGPALPCSAASANDVVNVILSSRFLERERCDNLGLVSVQLLQNLNGGIGVNPRPELTREQVREIATRYVEINAHLCEAITLNFSEQDAWARNYDSYARSNLANDGWDRFFADEAAVKWARITAGFRTELITLNSVINLAVALRPDAFNPDSKRLRDLHLQEIRKLLQEIRRVSLTEEEAKVRFVLATLHDQPAFREMIPARLDADRLEAIEVKTRKIGLHFMRKHDVHLDDLYNPRMRMLLFTVENNAFGPKLNATVRTATTQIRALVSKYR